MNNIFYFNVLATQIWARNLKIKSKYKFFTKSNNKNKIYKICNAVSKAALKSSYLSDLWITVLDGKVWGKAFKGSWKWEARFLSGPKSGGDSSLGSGQESGG